MAGDNKSNVGTYTIPLLLENHKVYSQHGQDLVELGTFEANVPRMLSTLEVPISSDFEAGVVLFEQKLIEKVRRLTGE